MYFKPAAYTSLAPYLIVDGAARTMAFLEQVFDAQRLRCVPAPEGGVRHAELRVDDTVLMLADANAGWPAVGAHVHLYVRDVEATYARALAAGATPVQAPVRRDDEDRRGGIRDPGGTTWWIATREV